MIMNRSRVFRSFVLSRIRRLYALAGELNVRILVHFQEAPHTPTGGIFATGFNPVSELGGQ